MAVVKKLMTFDKVRCRWVKMVNGDRITVSCRKQGWPTTEAGSASYANRWWINRESGEQPLPKRQQTVTIEPDLIPLVASLTSVVSVDEAKEILTPKTKRDKHSIESEFQLEIDRQGLVNSILSQRRVKRNLGYFQGWLASKGIVNCSGITDEIIRQYHATVQQLINEGTIAFIGGRDRLQTALYITSLLASKSIIPPPPVLLVKRSHLRLSNRKAPRRKKVKPDNWLGQLATLRDVISRSTDRQQLYLLLGLNCGYRQKDIAELHPDEVSWVDGTTFELDNGKIVTLPAGYICNHRTKTRKTIIIRKLWPKTWELLKALGSKEGERVLSNKQGLPLLNDAIDYDGIYAPLRSWYKNHKVEPALRLPFAALRKTGSSMIGNSKEYRDMRHLYLGNIPDNINDIHYVETEYETFARATDWLRSEIFETK